MEAAELNADDGRLEASASCRVVVVYEDVTTQKLALTLADQMRARFGEDFDMEFSWWNTRFLGSAEMARDAHLEAVSADIILFSLHSDSELPAMVKGWIEGWLPERLGQTGALAVLTNPAEAWNPRRREVEAYLAEVAQRAEMDYLMVADPARVGPLGGYQSGTKPLSTQEDTHWYPNTSSHWGINE